MNEEPTMERGNTQTGDDGNGHTVEMSALSAPWSAAQPLRAPRAPTGEVVAMAERQPRQASQVTADAGGTVLRISLRDVVYFLGAIMTIAAIVWTLRSDIRDLKTTMDLQNKLQEERWQRQADDMKKFSGVQTLQGYDIQDLKLALASAGLYAPKKPVTITNIPQSQENPR